MTHPHTHTHTHTAAQVSCWKPLTAQTAEEQQRRTIRELREECDALRSNLAVVQAVLTQTQKKYCFLTLSAPSLAFCTGPWPPRSKYYTADAVTQGEGRARGAPADKREAARGSAEECVSLARPPTPHRAARDHQRSRAPFFFPFCTSVNVCVCVSADTLRHLCLKVCGWFSLCDTGDVSADRVMA